MGSILPLKRDAATNLPAEIGSGDYVVPVAFNDQTGTSYTLALTDAANGVRCTNASAIAVSIDKHANVALPRYCRIPVRQGGVGVITVQIVSGSGVTLRTPNGANTTAQGDGRVLEQVDIDTWVLW
jgi:hypothetical protein